ncbi:MAG: hypothetical protein ACAF41_12525 [Leptolyngbya sp. BL-A-14]
MRISITGKTEQLLAEAMLITSIESPNEALAFVLNRYLPDLRQWYGTSTTTPPPSAQPSDSVVSFTGEGLEPISL